MSEIKISGGFNELPESAEARLRLGLGGIDEESWKDRSGIALAEATKELTGPVTILGVMNVEKIVDSRSEVVGEALRSYDSGRLLAISEHSSLRARAQREMLGAHTCALLLASSPEVSEPLKKMPVTAIEAHIPYATALLDQERTRRNVVMDPMKKDKYMGGMFVGLRSVFGDATKVISKVEPKGLTASLDMRAEEEDFARGFSVIATAVARLTGAITLEQAEAPLSETETTDDGELFFPESFLLSVPKASPDQLGLIVAETKNPDYVGIKMSPAHEAATGNEDTVESVLKDQDLEVLIQIRRRVSELVYTYGTSPEKSNTPLGFDTIAMAIASAKPEFVDIIRSLKQVPANIVEEAIMDAWRQTQTASSETTGSRDLGIVNKKLGLAEFPLLNSMGDGLNKQSLRISGISKQGRLSGQDENQEAYRNGGRMHLKILAGIIDKLRTQPPAAEAA